MPVYIKLRPRIKETPGASPGTVLIPDNAIPTIVTAYSFNQEKFEEKEILSIDDLKKHLKSNATLYHWFDVKGLGSEAFLQEIAKHFKINKLELEDITNVNQHPKVEEHDDHLFIISRMVEKLKENNLSNEQIAIMTFEKTVITFQENYDDVLDPVRTRLRNGKGNIRTGGSMYLSYAIIDVIIDNYFPILNSIADRLDDLEERLLKNPSKKIMVEIQELRRVLLVFRRAIGPEKEKIAGLLRSSSPFITEETKFYLKDVNDHCIHVIDTLESYREITSGLMDLYMSTISNRTNEVVKLLTVISSIFIPLTFIVGIYGMNFSTVDPNTGAKLPLNMPELYSPYGYVVSMSLMLFIAIGQLFYFWKKGWLK